METDFLNFRDGAEHFDYQSSLLDDSQGSLLDVIGDDYSSHRSDYWQQAVESELNGDIAIIPVAGYIDAIPKLSNSPPAKDFHWMFGDLHEHLASLEAEHAFASDMFDCVPPVTAVRPIPRMGGKNLELMKSIIKDELDDDEDDEPDEQKTKPEPIVEQKIKLEYESDDDCIDIETVTEQMPVLEAGDLTSLLEQFEASEAFNPKVEPDAEPKKPERKPARRPDTLSDELIQKLKASSLKKQISVIPAIPKKRRDRQGRPKAKPEAAREPDATDVQMDHDYCRAPDDDANSRIKNAILTQQKLTAIRSDNLLKGAPKTDSKIMVSLLKSNRNTVVSTTNTNDEQVHNIIVEPKSETKKRKLNLEEYKRLRGDVIKCNSTGSSRGASPVNPEKEEDKLKLHQELMMKMASEILKTPVRSKTTSDVPLEVFVPPDSVPKPAPEVAPVVAKDADFEMKTIVSIGVNTVQSITELPVLTPILQSTNHKISSNSLIANITATFLQQKPEKILQHRSEDIVTFGEDKTVIVLYKNRSVAPTQDAGTQTEQPRRTFERQSSSSRSESVSSDSSFSSSSSWSSRSRSTSPRRSRRRRRMSRSRSRDMRIRSRSPFRRKSKETVERERMREVEERRVVYVGNIENDMTKSELKRRFQRFGPITNVSVHFREHGDNYGFVTYAYKVDAYEAVENGNSDREHQYDISFGGRRAFCKTRYSDLDNIEDDPVKPVVAYSRKDEDSFDILLRELQEKLLRKRKV